MKTISLILLISMICSCNSSNSNEVGIAAEKKIKQIETKKEQTKKSKILELTKKYNIKFDLDTIDYWYSKEYETIISENNHLISKLRYIHDVFERDSNSYIRLLCGENKVFDLNLKIVNSTLTNQILHNFKFGQSYNDIFLVIKILKIKKGHLQYEIEQNSDVYMEPEISIGFDHQFYGQGELVEILDLNIKETTKSK